jgi:hypothetical protein
MDHHTGRDHRPHAGRQKRKASGGGLPATHPAETQGTAARVRGKGGAAQVKGIPERPFWADAELMRVPKRWQERMEAEWRELAEKSRGGADAWLRRRLDELKAAERAGLNPSMDDAAIYALAESEARDYRAHLATIEGQYRVKWQHMPDEYRARCIVWKQGVVCRDLMAGRGLLDQWPDGPGMTEAGKLARLADPVFWRRVFRRAHARTLEQCAIALGLVRADGDCYISRESRGLVAARQAANAAMLAKTVAVSEYGDEKTLAELAERSVSNPTIRRGELMTRVAGFEACADALGHVKRWAVITCPSRMHKWTKLDNGKTVPNKRYDGTKPREAQQYLAQQWRKLCAWWERQGLRVYGFRTTEPHHDGCPHWNLLAFFAPMTERIILKKLCKPARDAVAVFDQGLREYFLLNDSPTEPGADRHRVRVEAIDSEKGSAAAYIAKYISKGIDGKGLQVDLYGNPIEESAPSVVAWARVWGIRQFQQIGGPPVSVWRELRRLHPEQESSDLPDTLKAALAAVNLQMVEPGEKKAIAWARYTTAQGGPCAKRKAWSVRLLKQDREGVNRYGEPKARRVVGVIATGRVPVPVPAHMRHLPGVDRAGFSRPIVAAVESERAEWVVVPKAAADDAFEAHCQRLAAKLEEMDQAAQRIMLARIEQYKRQAEAVEALAEGKRPWTRVNNCTALSWTPTLDSIDRRAPENPFGLKAIHRQKIGRFFDWKQGAGGPLQKATA